MSGFMDELDRELAAAAERSVTEGIRRLDNGLAHVIAGSLGGLGFQSKEQWAEVEPHIKAILEVMRPMLRDYHTRKLTSDAVDKLLGTWL